MSWIGVDLGGLRVTTVALDSDGEQLAELSMRTPRSGDRLEVVDVLETAVRSVVDDADLTMADVSGVGVATPGMVVGGTIGGASNVPGWSERFSLAEMLGDRLGPPIRLVNDVTAAAVAEHRFGAARGEDDALVVFAGTGVGAGLILNGGAYLGGHGGAGEFGHTVVVHNGATCPCGRRGCVEAYTGRKAMVRTARHAMQQGRSTTLFDLAEEQGTREPTSGTFRIALEQGDELVTELLTTAVQVLGAGIASVVNLLDVDLVVVGGGLGDELGDWYRHRVESAMRPHLFLQPPTVTMAPAQLGAYGGAVGAATVVHDHVEGRPVSTPA
ncbi:ROK family protein [Salsipaludibacter albus]|uniref:ROK family protein n=1 Tax=Salsipaludibacter albus TaxID=2849650 RepID=UPI001EE41686|nr:ROK family protein [Salsipaludibacter albus]MBY5163910.1 ROK family protein [Salsipaludibacter albus]